MNKLIAANQETESTISTRIEKIQHARRVVLEKKK